MRVRVAQAGHGQHRSAMTHEAHVPAKVAGTFLNYPEGRAIFRHTISRAEPSGTGAAHLNARNTLDHC